MGSFKRFMLKFIDQAFHDVIKRMSTSDTFLFLAIHRADRLVKWHRQPVIFGLAHLGILRHLYERYNLINVGKKELIGSPTSRPIEPCRGNSASAEETFFGRNLFPFDQKDKLMTPHPMEVATKLLERRKFVDTGKQFNMIAAAWIQFMIHDWVDHVEDTNRDQGEIIEQSQCPLKSFKYYNLKEVHIENGDNGIDTGYLNRRTPWWDGSAIYGNDTQASIKVRTFRDGKLKISEHDGLLLSNQNGTIVSGEVRNTWSGLLALQALFVLEHNAVCDELKKKYPNLKDEELYRHARLVTTAVIAKVHTIDWTIELLKTDTLRAGMRANWYGVLGKKFKEIFGSTGVTALSGAIGLKKPNDHGTPYSLTEEFVSVYRMHPLLPDRLRIRNVDTTPGPNKSPPVLEETDMAEMIGSQGIEKLSEIGFTGVMVSMGHQACGSLELWNYPVWLRNLIPQNVDGTDRPFPIDLAALEIYRDRERSVARYNNFRRGLLLSPISKWEDLTDDSETVKILREVYGDNVEDLDILVGLMAEKKISGFAISETAFSIFLLMATRRLEADKYFTSEFNEKSYTKLGLEWVNTTESLKDVLNRHYPDMSTKWINSTSAFSVWDSSPEKKNLVPLYLRIPK